MLTFQNGVFQAETGPFVHRASSTLDQRSLTFTFDKMRDKRNDISKRKQWILSSENDKNTNIFPKYWQLLILLLIVCIFT